jgi:hypothetical protein
VHSNSNSRAYSTLTSRLSWGPTALLSTLALAVGCGGEADVARTASAAAPANAPSSMLATPDPPPSTTPAAAPSASTPASESAAPAASGAAPGAGQIDEENVYGPDRVVSAAAVPLLDENQKPLPQTDARPSAKSQTFDARMLLLARAITTGDADAALPAFFPVVAYAQVKDIPAPEKDWEQRLVGAFRRDVAEYRNKLGSEAASAKLVSVEVPEGKAKFMKPGSEGNRVGYYRVLRSKLVFRVPSGKEHALELTSMISWRGEWYVVHLHGFK